MDLHTDDCIICYEPLGLITDIEITPCFHMLHQTCLTRWLGQSQSCPMCRTSIPYVAQQARYYNGTYIPDWNIPALPAVQFNSDFDADEFTDWRRMRIVNFESRWISPYDEDSEPEDEPVNEPVGIPNTLRGNDRVYARQPEPANELVNEPVESLDNFLRRVAGNMISNVEVRIGGVDYTSRSTNLNPVRQDYTTRSTISRIEPETLIQEPQTYQMIYRSHTNFQTETIFEPLIPPVNTETTIPNRPKYQHINKIYKPNRNHMMRMNNRSDYRPRVR